MNSFSPHLKALQYRAPSTTKKQDGERSSSMLSTVLVADLLSSYPSCPPAVLHRSIPFGCPPCHPTRKLFLSFSSVEHKIPQFISAVQGCLRNKHTGSPRQAHFTHIPSPSLRSARPVTSPRPRLIFAPPRKNCCQIILPTNTFVGVPVMHPAMAPPSLAHLPWK